jgi:hypothetical protein
MLVVMNTPVSKISGKGKAYKFIAITVIANLDTNISVTLQFFLLYLILSKEERVQSFWYFLLTLLKFLLM